MISPKYSSTHYFHSSNKLAGKSGATPHIVNLFLDYNCPFSAKLYFKLYQTVIPKLEEKHPGKFQFVYVNVIQPWHTNSNLLNEFALGYAKLLRESSISQPNEDFWKLSEVLYKNKESFYDTSNIDLTRNQIYSQIYDVVSKDLRLSFSREVILEQLEIPHSEAPSNAGNKTATDVKYFTRYLRGVGAHITPTVSVDGIINDSISSGTPEEELIELFEKSL
ncbi:hypothetical protein JA1_002612 [Spathaspora sp. JA1]|nr:hypothetical protein JA1_002612 [Spathaspora sp. JA1]